MSKLIDTVVSHFSSQSRREMHVPEWGVTLYAKNLTLEDKANWLKRADNDSTDFLVYTVIFGVTDEAGEPLFDIGDKIKLRRSADPEVVANVASFVLERSAETDEGREKN